MDEKNKDIRETIKSRDGILSKLENYKKDIDSNKNQQDKVTEKNKNIIVR